MWKYVTAIFAMVDVSLSQNCEQYFSDIGNIIIDLCVNSLSMCYIKSYPVVFYQKPI